MMLIRAWSTREVCELRFPLVEGQPGPERYVSELKPVLDQAVSDKKITSAQEQAIVNRLQAGPLPLWNRPEKHKPTPAATPSSG